MLLPFTDGLVVASSYDDECRRLADRHYSRRTIGAPQFVGNGRKLVLRDAAGLVVFAWLFPDPAWVRFDGQTGFYNALFRNESGRSSSAIILEAEAAAVAKWGHGRAYTYIDPTRVRSPNPGYCFKRAGWRFVHVGRRGKHLLEKFL